MSRQCEVSNCTLEEVDLVISQCQEAKRHSYCPYSKFPVGAALLTKSGKIYTGCNVENAVFPVSVCAERTAIVKAVSEGEREFKAIAVSSDMKDSYITPCGPCRQTMAEFSLDMAVYMTRPDGEYEVKSVEQLLPLAFTPIRLQEERLSQEGESSTATSTTAAKNSATGDSNVQEKSS